MRDVTTGSTMENPPEGKKRNVWLWVIAGVSVIVLVVFALFAFRSTTVTATPNSHKVTFNESTRFAAYPALGSAPGALTYTLVSNDLEDSAVVPSQGSEHVSLPAGGTVTVYNDYSTASVRLLKNTRLATPEGLIFRVPAAVVIPGKKGTTPGSVTVTVVADQSGEKYNVAPVARFTLPGLKSSPAEYAKVYARSTQAMSGGFVGDRAAVAPGALESARAEIRGRLESKARETTLALASPTSTVFPDLVRITYTSMPETVEAGGGARVHEKAHVDVPVFSAPALATAVARIVGAGGDISNVTLVTGKGLLAHSADATPTSVLGEGPISFTLNGTGILVWNIDTAALSAALAGRNQSAFQSIIAGFPAIQEARARIEPFWKSTFPANATDIHIDIIRVATTS